MLSALDYLTVWHEHIFVTNISSGAVYDLEKVHYGPAMSWSIRSLQGDGNAHGVTIVNERAGFVTRSGVNRVDMFDPATHQILHQAAVGAGPDAILHDPSTGLVYAASGDAKLASLIDAKTGAVVATINLPGTPEFAVLDSVSGLIYQNLNDINAFAAIDLKSRELAALWSLSDCDGPSGLAIDSQERLLFVVCTGNSRLVIVNLESHRIVRQLPIGRLSDSVAFDSVLKRLYVASGVGELVVIAKLGVDQQYQVAHRLPTRIGGHTVTVDPQTHKVYLAESGIISAPRLAVFVP